MTHLINTSLGQISCSIEGSGNTNLLFIHNAGGSKAFYNEQKALTKKYRCIFIDLPGHGESPPPKIKKLTLKSSAQALFEVCVHLQIKSAVLIGLNLGGNIAWHLASMKPSFLKGTIAIDPPCFMDQAFISELKKHMAKIQSDNRLDHLKELVNNSFVQAPHESYQVALFALEKTDIMTLISLYEDLIKEDISTGSLIQHIDTKLHVISTDANFCPIKHLQQSNPKATFSKVVNSLYWACLEVPEQVNAIIDRFIQVNIL